MRTFLLKDYKFGYADADDEMNEQPGIIENAFYDGNNNLARLLYGSESILIGRKGMGKTAFGAKIKKLSEKDDKFIVKRISLSNFDYNSLKRFSSSRLKGGKRYLIHWEEALLLKLYEILEQFIPEVKKSKEFSQMIKTLKSYGLLKDKSISHVVRKVSKNNFRISLPLSIGCALDLGEKELELNSPYEVYEVLKDILRSISIQNYIIRVVIDGIDDVLRVKDYQSDIITGLIRACRELNVNFVKHNLPIKLIVLTRPRIIEKCNDPDFNKIISDHAIELEWNEEENIDINTSDLMCLLKKRFEFSGVPKSELNNIWYKIFPKEINGKSSWCFILDHTLYRPRDLIMFLKKCQYKYGDKERLTISEVKMILNLYSNKYFFGEMKDDLTGFLGDQSINKIAYILNTIGKKTFSYNDWKRAVKENNVSLDDGNLILRAMFENGYIGTIRRYNKRERTLFSYKNSNVQFSYKDRFTLQSALQRNLNFK